MPARVVVVEDDANTLTLVVGLLSGVGFAPVGYSSFAAAAPALRSAPPDLLVTDLVLGDGSGLDLVRLVRGAREDARIVVVSGQKSEEDVARGLAAGADAYVGKPFTSGELLAAVLGA